MIKKINRLYENELVVLKKEIIADLEKGIIHFEFKPGTEIDGTIQEVDGSLRIDFDFNKYQLVFSGFIDEEVTVQESKLFLIHSLEEIFVRLINQLQEEYGIQIVARSSQYWEFTDWKGRPIIDMFYRSGKQYLEWEHDFETTTFIQQRNQVYKEFQYFEKHETVRQDIKRFIGDLSGSQTTKTTYYFSIEKFYEWLIENHFDTYPEFDEEKINQFIIHIYRELKLSSYYINRTFTALLKYCKFIGKDIDRDKAAKRDLPSLPKLTEVLPRSLPEERYRMAEDFLRRRLSKAKLMASSPSVLATGSIRDHWRNLLIFQLCLDGCLRIHEAIGLDVEDINFDGKTPHMKVRGKGNKERKVPLAKFLIEDVQNYITWRKKNDYRVEVEKQLRHRKNGRKFNFNGKKVEMIDILLPHEVMKCDEIASSLKLLNGEVQEDLIEIQAYNQEIEEIEYRAITREVQAYFVEQPALFVSNRTRRVSINAIQRVFSELGRQKIDDVWIKGTLAVQAHELRHTGIKMLVDNNVSINKIQLITGHESADMVLRYSKAGIDEAADAIEGMRNRD